MRRDQSEIPFSGRAPRQAVVPDDRHVTYHMGRAYLNESSIRDPDHSVKPDNLKAIREHSAEEAENRQAYKDANFAAALNLGEALRVLKGDE